MDMNDVLEDSAYKDKVNQSYLKVILEDEGYNMFVLGFWTFGEVSVLIPRGHTPVVCALF